MNVTIDLGNAFALQFAFSKAKVLVISRTCLVDVPECFPESVSIRGLRMDEPCPVPDFRDVISTVSLFARCSFQHGGSDECKIKRL